MKSKRIQKEAPGPKEDRIKEFLREIKRNKGLYLMCMPALIVLVMFCYIPFAGTWMAFTDFNVMDGIFGSKFVGLNNFKYFFSESSMGWRVTYNTLFINFFGIILGLIVPISISIFFNEIRSELFKKLTQSFMFFPYFLSWVVVGTIIYGFFFHRCGRYQQYAAIIGNGTGEVVCGTKVLEGDHNYRQYVEVERIQLHHLHGGHGDFRRFLI